MDMEAYQKGDRNFRSTSRDVYDILIDMQKQGVEGIVVDLRNNGGGALFEANLLTDLFIDPGVVVQIRDADKEVSRRNRARQPMMYSGPLVVLTNRLSASASEIFAGAIQDYQRGIIVGTPTFGKGTVQSVEPFDGGALKLTQSMFYRVNGHSTQFDGVTPDILFPLQYNPEDIGESAYKYALNGTPIAEVAHNTWIDTGYYAPTLNELHQKRTDNDPDFNFLRSRYKLHQEIADINEVSLDMAKRKAEKELRDAQSLSLENERRIAKGREPLEKLEEALEEDEALLKADAERKEGKKEDDTDFVLDEAEFILLDLVDVTRRDNIGRWVSRSAK